MLKPVRRSVIGAPLFAGLLLSPALTVPAAAEPTPTGGATRCEVTAICAETHETATKPPTGGGGTGGGTGGSSNGPQVCTYNGQNFACSDPELGWFSAARGCYFRAISPPPAEGDPRWQGHKPSEGAVYNATCVQADGNLGAAPAEFFAQPPAGPPPDNPAQLARDARAKITFPPVKPGLAPKDASVVGAPVWLWLQDAAVPTAGQARGNTLTVTVTPRLAWVKWTFGDGTTVTCSGAAAAGTPYDPAYADKPSPTCGHVFTTGSGSRKDGLFHGTVRAQWIGDVTVSDGTRIDPIEVPLTADIAFKVAEVQVLNQPLQAGRP
ncbi:hypothetical protein [Kitasatospora sp. NPDC093806]|uniref:hypothetical protein n=1 Tax=Kitasatospora sp. NPDC093806 TaxID=3155075 RepID=UPI0034418405